MSRSPRNDTAELAQEGLAILEQQLKSQPPEGVTASDVEGVFRRQRPALVAALAGMLGAIADRQSDGPPSLRAVSSGDRMLAEIERLLDDGKNTS